MSIQFANRLDATKIKLEIQENIYTYKLQYSLVMSALEIVKGFEGKAITKRIATKIQENEAFKLYTVSYDTNYGMFNINIWGNGVHYDNRIRMMLGHDSSPFINMQRVLEHTTCYTLNKERFRSLESLDQTKLMKIIEKFNKGLELMQEAHKEAEEVHGLEYKVDLQIR